MKLFPRAWCVATLAAGLICPRGAALEAGAAKLEFVPAANVPLDGDFSRRGRPATGTHDPLFVRALFLQGQDSAVFVVTVDLFAVSPDLRARVLDRAPTTVPHENIVLVATHILNGPGGLDRSWLGRQRGGRYIQQHVDALAAKIAEAMQLAYDGRKRASAGYAATETALVVNRFDPAAPVDGQMGVLRLDDSDGNPIAILANFGVAPHGETGPRHFMFSAGLPGAFCGALESMTNPGAVAFFLNGASADQSAARVDGLQPFSGTLASRAKALANDIKCREVNVSLHTATLPVPLNSALPFYPTETAFQALEIDKLAMLFVPAIPGGGAGAALRKAVWARGYAQCMIVAPANAYMGAAASEETIGVSAEGAEPVYLGPGGAAWLHESAMQPLTRGQAAGRDDKPALREAKMQVREEKPALRATLGTKNGVVYLTQTGTPAEIGAVRGRMLRDSGVPALAAGLPSKWLIAACGGVLGHWNLLAPATSLEALALPIAGESSRPLLRGVGQETVACLGAMSEAAGVPFATLWLRQIAPASDPPSGPAGIAFASETAKDGIVLGQTIEWPAAERIVVSRVRPKVGHAYVTAGFSWHAGGVAGVNDRGLAVAISPVRASSTGAMCVPAEMLIADVLARAATFDQAVELLNAPRPDFSGNVLIAFDDGKKSRSATVTLGNKPAVNTESVPGALESARDIRVQSLIRSGSAFSIEGAEHVLVDRDRRAAEGDRIFGPQTRACIVLAPRRRELRIMAPDAGAARVFDAVTLREGES